MKNKHDIIFQQMPLPESRALVLIWRDLSGASGVCSQREVAAMQVPSEAMGSSSCIGHLQTLKIEKNQQKPMFVSVPILSPAATRWGKSMSIAPPKRTALILSASTAACKKMRRQE
jgi:hypothetical protein